MAYIYYKHAKIDRFYPRALGLCDRCGLTYNHKDLLWQDEWRGPKIQNLRIAVCPTCRDKPQEQLRQIVIPADPIPIRDPREEPYIVEVNSAIWEEVTGTWLLAENGSALLLESQNTPTPQSSGVIYDWGQSS